MQGVRCISMEGHHSQRRQATQAINEQETLFPSGSTGIRHRLAGLVWWRFLRRAGVVVDAGLGAAGDGAAYRPQGLGFVTHTGQVNDILQGPLPRPEVLDFSVFHGSWVCEDPSLAENSGNDPVDETRFNPVQHVKVPKGELHYFLPGRASLEVREPRASCRCQGFAAPSASAAGGATALPGAGPVLGDRLYSPPTANAGTREARRMPSRGRCHRPSR